MLPGGLVYTREGSYPNSLTEPIVQKMEQGAAQGSHGKACKLPKSYRSFHSIPQAIYLNKFYSKTLDNILKADENSSAFKS
jgi:hypothetical protein